LEKSQYPVLTRLEKRQLIIGRIGKSPYGPKRKYFNISKDGKSYLGQFKKTYLDIIVLCSILVGLAGAILKKGIRLYLECC